MGEEISPRSIMRFGRSMPTSGIGMAESRALVYGCIGCSKSSSVGAFSTSWPRYITAMSSAKWLTTDKSWVMKMKVSPIFSFKSWSKFSICA